MTQKKRLHRERNRCQGNRGIPKTARPPRICRESPLTKGSRMILLTGKGLAPFPASGKDGSGQRPGIKFRAGDAQRRGCPF